ncbi:phosphopentomutase [Lachnospiraceae bacterium PF1-4]
MIRKARETDIERMEEIFAIAREYMKASGNLSQWQEGYPGRDLLKEDISAGKSYVITGDDDEVVGTFYFSREEDPTYREIDGAWLNTEPYGVIHRIASDGKRKGIVKEALEYCLQQTDNLRIDTHEDNQTMQQVLEKLGFKRCGVIRLANGEPRVAFQYSQIEPSRSQRAFLIVIDSVGAGAASDAAAYGDEGADTLGHTAQAVGGLHLPNLEKLGLGNIHKLEGVKPVTGPLAQVTKLNEKSVGKDTMTGHWEMMGVYTTEPFITFTDTGFPAALIKELEEKTGHPVIGNVAASGTEIMNELGEEHLKTEAMIVYTSADSVLQILANEETFGLEELYRCCEIAREITMKPEWRVGRVIARPFIGKKKGEFVRTANRHDYALRPPRNVLDELKDHGLDVIAIGKINDIFDGQGITRAVHSASSVQGMEQTIVVAGEAFNGLCFVNLVDFDAKWGHRRNPVGYAKELEAFDQKLGELMPLIKPGDVLMITADHGNDPTFEGTDHTREKVPFLKYLPGEEGGVVPEGSGFSVIGEYLRRLFIEE